jgi:hypothetical protein
MHVLRHYIERIEGLGDFVSRMSDYRITQGVVLDVNPYWLIAYRLSRAGLQPEAIRHWLNYWPPTPMESLVPYETIEGDEIDFSWTDRSGWVDAIFEHILGRRKGQINPSNTPFLVKAIARPVSLKDAEIREKLVSFAALQSFLAIVETRPLGSLAVAQGDSCLAGNLTGTIGGFLRDTNSGERYATTCGHVASPGVTITVAGVPIGTCTLSHPPIQLPKGQFCTSGCPGINKLDFALVDIGNIVATNSAKSVAKHIAPKQPILMRGKNGPHQYEAGGTLVAYDPGISNVCFENLFEVRPAMRAGLLNPKVAAAFATVPTQGDSGAWLETIPGSKWCGVLVAADTVMGYALDAEEVVANADAVFGTKLTLI